MGKKFDQLTDDNKGFIIFYLVWSLLQLLILFIYWDTGDSADFWPFENINIKVYDFTEFAFYIISPVIIFFIWKLIRKKSNKID
jgi:hypothetical protein